MTILALDAAIVGFIVIAAAFHALVPILWVIVAILVFVEVNFFSLTVTVDRESLRVRFGVGLIRITFPLSDLVRARTVTNPWYAGWGIRTLSDGWLFNVSGLDAVEIETRAGRRHRVGTDQPAALEAAVNRAIGVT
jgi:hypothetical protein